MIPLHLGETQQSNIDGELSVNTLTPVNLQKTHQEREVEPRVQHTKSKRLSHSATNNREPEFTSSLGGVIKYLKYFKVKFCSIRKSSS